MKYIIYASLAAAFVGCLAREEPTTTGTPWTPNPICPYPSEETVFYPDPDDCSKYYECSDGNLYIMNCPDNLYWNADADACDYLENTNCSSLSTTPGTTGTGPTATPTEAVSTSPAPIATSTPPSGNLCANQPDGTYFANPANCHDFYECIAGKEIEGVCPTGTVWNEEILNCDFPENVVC